MPPKGRQDKAQSARKRDTSNMAKKIDVKVVAKENMSKTLAEFFESKGLKVEDGEEYGKTAGTLIIKKGEDLPCDMQVKLITPKRGVDEYSKEEAE